ncbi:MAG: hypothetical protein RJA98_93 [Pseudomonadota bacterium]|jgi:peptidyl-prolyl cis-trans isomerase SurA
MNDIFLRAVSGGLFRAPLRTATLALLMSGVAGAGVAQGRAAAGAAAVAAAAVVAPASADYIQVVVNQEVVTHAELVQRLAQVRAEAARGQAALPADDELSRQVLDALIDERVQLSHARDSGQRVDDVELDRAVANVAQQNQITIEQLRERLRSEGLDLARFRNNLRDQMMVERVREREVQGRIRISDADVDALLAQNTSQRVALSQFNIAHILVRVPEGASEAEVAAKRALANDALRRVLADQPFEAVARAVSEDAGTRDEGGVLGMRAADRLPDLFVNAVRELGSNSVAPMVQRSGAGFHVLKLIERRDSAAFTVTQTHARHILLRPSAQLNQAAALKRLSEFRADIVAKKRSFEQLARANSEDGSAEQGGDLGWASPGMFVPEFEQAMNALPDGGLSQPLVSRFGVHLLQVIERRQATVDARQQREQARNQLRAQRYETAYADWLRDLRSRAYIEEREAPK